MGHRKRRKTIFVACEGESEQGYVAMLQHFADVDGLHVYLDGKVPGGTGNAQTLVSKANEIVRKEQQPNGVNYLSRYIILDSDGLGVAEAKDLRKKASEEEVKLVFQDCCFEAFLLRHFEATKDAAPPNADEAKKQLDKVWKGYRKALSAQKLMKKLNLDMVRSAAMRPQNRDFKELLRDIGLLS